MSGTALRANAAIAHSTKTKETMEFPKRDRSHIQETESYKLFVARAPSHWIVRQVTERDYGIDLYVELCDRNGEVRGDLCSIQLKGPERLHWTARGNTSRSVFSGIKKSTVNYWIAFPVPVFLVVADLAEGELYWAPVKEQVRELYQEYEDQDSLGFVLEPTRRLKSESDIVAVEAAYRCERQYPEFERSALALFSRWTAYRNYMSENQGRDEFMPIEHDCILALEDLYKTCEVIARYLSLAWTLPSLERCFALDRAMWKERYELLHEGTQSKILEKLEPLALQCATAARDWVLGRMAYWMAKNQVLYNFCMNFEPAAER